MTINIPWISAKPNRWRKYARMCRERGVPHVFVNGVEIHSVFYVDVRRGIVKTFDVRGDGTLATVTRGCPFPIDPSWDAPLDGVLSKTIYAKRVKIVRRHA